MIYNNNLYKMIMRKTEVKKNNKKCTCCFFAIWNLKSARTYKWGGAALSMHKLILPSENLHCIFHILSMHYALYFPACIFTLQFPCFSFFNRPQLKIGAVNQINHLCFRKRRCKELFLKCRQINWKRPAMNFIFQQKYSLKACNFTKNKPFSKYFT